MTKICTDLLTTYNTRQHRYVFVSVFVYMHFYLNLYPDFCTLCFNAPARRLNPAIRLKATLRFDGNMWRCPAFFKANESFVQLKWNKRKSNTPLRWKHVKTQYARLSYWINHLVNWNQIKEKATLRLGGNVSRGLAGRFFAFWTELLPNIFFPTQLQEEEEVESN